MTDNSPSSMEKMVIISAPVHRICSRGAIVILKTYFPSLYMLKQLLLTSKDTFPLKIFFNISGTTLKKSLAIDTIFDPPLFSSDYTFNRIIQRKLGGGVKK